jgi:hypothetical protein
MQTHRPGKKRSAAVGAVAHLRAGKKTAKAKVRKVTPFNRMMKKVRRVYDKLSCWVFTGAKDQNGHGNVRVHRRGKWTCIKAHKVAYEHYFGSVPEKKVVRHKCDNRACVRKKHLTVGTMQENTQDMILRGRAWWQKQGVVEDYSDVPF